MMKKIVLLLLIICNIAGVGSQEKNRVHPLFTTGINELFFGNSAAELEFLWDQSFVETQGLRIYRDTVCDTYIMEVKYVANWPQTNDSINKLFPPKDNVKTITEAQWQELKKQLQAEQVAKKEKIIQCLSVQSRVIQLSDSLANELILRTLTVIKNNNAVVKKRNEDGLISIVRGGYSVLLQCRDDMQTNTIERSMPEGDVKYLSDLFRQIISDVRAGDFEESKFVELLKVLN